MDLVVLTVLVVAAGALFWDTTRTAFVGDDFFWLFDGSHWMSTPGQWWAAFTQPNGADTYRPLTQNVFFWFCWQLFGFHPLGFHLVILATFLLSVVMIYRLCRALNFSPFPALAATSIFAFSNTHYDGLAWTSAFCETGTTLVVAAAMYFVVTKKRGAAVLFYVIGLLCNETAAVVPAIALLYEVAVRRVRFRTALRNTQWLWCAAIVYGIFRLIIGFHPGGAFSMTFSALGWIRLTGSAVVQGLGLTSTFHNALSGAGDWRAPALLALILCSTVAVGVATLWWQKARESVGLLIFGAGTFVIGLLPLLPFSRDWSYYNLAIPLIGVSIVVAALLQWVPIGNVLSVVAAAGIFLVNVAAVYGPEGLNAVDGVRVLSKEAQFVDSHVVAARAKTGAPVSVDVLGDPSATEWTVQPGWLPLLLDPGGKVYIGPTTAPVAITFSLEDGVAKIVGTSKA